MKTTILYVALAILVGSTQINVAQTISLSKNNAILNVGESTELIVSITVPTGFDASVFLSASCSTLKGTADFGSNSPIINYPYLPSRFTIKTLPFTRKGTHILTISARINDTIISEKFSLEILNPTPWRIFEYSNYGETKPGFFTLDWENNIFFNQRDYRKDKIMDIVYYTSVVDPRFTYHDPIVPAGPPAFQLVIDSMNKKYYLTSSGVYFYPDNSGKNVTIYNTSTSTIPSNTVTRGVLDKSGRLWVGTPLGLASLVDYNFVRYDNNPIIGKDTITALAVDKNNRLWIGTPNGLVMYDGKKWQRYTPQNSGLPAPYIFGMATDRKGNIWMGAGSNAPNRSLQPEGECPNIMAGLVRFDGTEWQVFNSQNSPLVSNNVSELTVDIEDNLWIATGILTYGEQTFIKGSGLLKYDGNSWENYTTENSPLPDNNVQWVGADRLGNIWFVCSERFGVVNLNGLPFKASAVSEQPATSDGIHLFPNPTSTQFTLSGVEGVASVRVVNSLGEEVRKWSEGQGTREIDVSNLANGLYFVSIRTAKGAVVKPMLVRR